MTSRSDEAPGVRRMTDEAMRAEFEEWARSQGWNLSQENSFGEYWEHYAQYGWAAWQAAQAAGAGMRDATITTIATLHGDRFDWLCEKCRVLHPHHKGDGIPKKCPTCRAAMVPSSDNLRQIAELKRDLDRSRAHLAIFYGDDTHPENRCQRCRGRNVTWHAESEVWNRVVGARYSILCPICFVQMAEEAGEKVASWRVGDVHYSAEHDADLTKMHRYRIQVETLQAERARRLARLASLCPDCKAKVGVQIVDRRGHAQDGVDLIGRERDTHARKGWDMAHDDGHTNGELAIVAAALAVFDTDAKVIDPEHNLIDEAGFDRWGLAARHNHGVRLLIIAGALIAAEIDRILRVKDIKP